MADSGCLWGLWGWAKTPEAEAAVLSARTAAWETDHVHLQDKDLLCCESHILADTFLAES